MRRRTTRNPARAAVSVLLVASAVALAGCAGTGVAAHGAEEQLRFGVSMAQQGLWSEALFRFEKARQLDPGNPKVLNNIAVALEAAGRYDDALEAYREALGASPGNRDLQANYARFLDFYESFRVVEDGEGEALIPETENTP